MKASATAKTIASIAACLLAGAISLHCGPTDPISGGPPADGGNGAGGAGGAGASPTAGAGGGGNTGIISAPPPAGGSTGASSDAAVVVPASPDANCGIQTENPTPQAVDLLLVLDRSASMSYNIASDTSCTGGAAATCTGRWSTVTTALNQVLGNSPGVQWGLKFFPSLDGGKCGVDSPGVDVEVGPNSTTQVQSTITSNGPGSTGTQTPTTAAIQAAVAYFNTVNDGLTHYILLATDGLPNCDPGTSSEVTDASVQDTAGVIGTAYNSSGISTFVIGMGPSTGNLDSFAQAGGTGTYFPATSPDDLSKALGTIIVAVQSCVFTMTAAPPDPSNLGVYLDKDTKVPLDPSDGYSLAADNVTVTFNGSYCDGLKSGSYQVVQVYFGCPGSPPPQNIQ